MRSLLFLFITLGIVLSLILEKVLNILSMRYDKNQVPRKGE